PHRCKCSKHGSSPKAGGGCAAEPKNPADPCADASQWCNLPARRPCKRDEPRPPFVAAGSASAAGRRKYSRSKTPLVPSAPNSNPHSSAACQCLEGETPWSSAGVDSCV